MSLGGCESGWRTALALLSLGDREPRCGALWTRLSPLLIPAPVTLAQTRKVLARNGCIGPTVSDNPASSESSGQATCSSAQQGKDELPIAATMSVEVDVPPIADSNAMTAQLADPIEGVAGKWSPFDEQHGFSIDAWTVIMLPG